SFCYTFLFSTTFLKNKQSNGLQVKYHTDDISLLFTLLEYSFPEESNTQRPLEEAQQFLIDLGLNSLYLDFHKYVLQTNRKLRSLSSCFKNTETHGGCIIIPFNQPEKFEYLNHLVAGNSLESMEPNLIRGEAIFSSVSIEGLSSGELNIINFIGNLKQKLDYFNGIIPIILLDEVEHTFHPEWQRLLIHTLSTVFEMKNIKPQVVLSTHSPFLLSDILNRKTLSLGNDKSAELKTFAANIHDILNSKFFMKRSIGESAAKLIIQCIELIEELSVSDQEQDLSIKIMKAKMIIDQVNDPVVKSELNSRLGLATAKSNSLRKRLFELIHGDFTEAELASELDKLR
ncbi:TPA: AAA family ATPase, partial [Vibrio cholerae]|nr:AAA family ATPase [Vibrio cholerae]